MFSLGSGLFVVNIIDRFVVGRQTEEKYKAEKEIKIYSATFSLSGKNLRKKSLGALQLNTPVLLKDIFTPFQN